MKESCVEFERKNNTILIFLFKFPASTKNLL